MAELATIPVLAFPASEIEARLFTKIDCSGLSHLYQVRVYSRASFCHIGWEVLGLVEEPRELKAKLEDSQEFMIRGKAVVRSWYKHSETEIRYFPRV